MTGDWNEFSVPADIRDEFEHEESSSNNDDLGFSDQLLGSLAEWESLLR